MKFRPRGRPWWLRAASELAAALPRGLLMVGQATRARAVVVLAFASTGFTIGTVSYSFGLFVQPLTDWSAARSLGPDGEGWTRTSINLSVTLTFLTYSLLGPAVGWAVDRYGPRVVAPLSLLCVSAGYVIIALGQSLGALYAGAVVSALGFGGATMASGGKLVGSWFSEKKGRVMGIVTSGNNAGGLVCINIGSLVLKHWGYRWMAGMFAIVLATVAVLFWLLVRDAPEEATSPAAAVPPSVAEDDAAAAAEEKTETATKEEGTEEQEEYTLREAMRQPRFYLANFGMVCAFWTYQMVLANMIPAMQSEGFSTEAAAASVTVVAALGFVSKLVSGCLSDSIGATFTMCGVMALQMCALIVFLIGATGEGGALSTACLWLFAVLYGAGFGGIGALLPLVVIETFGSKSFGAVHGAMNVGMAVPALVAPLVAGMCFDASGNYRLAFGLTIGVFGLGIVSLLLARCACCRPAPREKQALEPHAP